MTSGRTSNFGFPLYEGNDFTSWLVDFNGAMTDIDTAAQGIKTTAVNAGEAAAAAQGSVSQINQQLVNINNQLAAITAWQSGIWGSEITATPGAIQEPGVLARISDSLNLFNMYGSFRASEQISAGTTLFSLPIHPAATRSIYGAFITSGALLTAYIKSTGEVYISGDINANQYFQVQVMVNTKNWF